MVKERSSVAIAIAVILSCILVPLLLLLGIASATTSAFSNVVMEHREDELFARFEKEGGIRWIYNEIEARLIPMAQELEVPEGMEPLKDIVTYEDVSSISHGIYSAFLSGKQYVFDLSVQKERVRGNVDAYFDRYIDEQNLTELMDDGTVDIELVKESYLKDAYTQLEEQVTWLEEELNAKLTEVYHTPQFIRLAGTEELHGAATYLELLRGTLKKAELAEIGVMAVLVVLLLVCHLFRPSGFFVVGGTAIFLGAAAFVVSKGLHAVLFSGAVPAVSMPDQSFFATAEQIVLWLSDGYLHFGSYSAIAGVIFLVAGVFLLLFQRKRA